MTRPTLAMCLVLACAGCTAFTRTDFPCVDGACPGALACVADRCVASEGEGEGEGEAPLVVPFGDAAPVGILEVDDGLVVVWTQGARDTTPWLEAPGEGRQRSGLAHIDGAGQATLLADTGALAGADCPDADATAGELVVGLQIEGALALGTCTTDDDDDRRFLLASLDAADTCRASLEVRLPRTAQGALQHVAASGDARAAVISPSSPPLTFVGFESVTAPTASSIVIELRNEILRAVPLVGFALDLALDETGPIAVGSLEGRPWTFLDGVERTMPGPGVLGWEELRLLADGDLLVAGTGEGSIEGDPCPPATQSFHVVVARLARDTLSPRWVQGLCVEGRSVGFDLLAIDEVAGTVHVLGYTEGPLAIAPAATVPVPNPGTPVGMIVALDLDSGAGVRGRSAPFGRFVGATALRDGRLAISLTTGGGTLDGASIVGSALVVVAP